MASRRSLDLHLNNDDLTWIDRVKICIGVARDLVSLHTTRSPLHHLITSSHILLDDNWNPDISNFCYRSLVGPGTKAYSKDSNVFSFGAVMFEVLCGRLAIIDKTGEDRLLIPVVEEYYSRNKINDIVYSGIKDEINPSSLKAFAAIGIKCLDDIPPLRPQINIVLTNLETALTYQIFTDGLKLPLRAIETATNNFANDNWIGVGGFGKVYRGKLLHSGEQTLVAIKRLNREFGQGNPEFWKEVNTLSRYRHFNLVNLLGFCNESNEKILVYEYVCNRSLDLSLNNIDLQWVQWLNICIGAAHGLAYLHNPDGNQESIWHLDIKSGNILLDENYNPKIADLGLSRFGHENNYSTSGISDIVGTIGYCDPVYIDTGSPSKKSDVYSFGVVLFEVLSGRLCIGNTYEHRSLTVLAQRCYEQNNLNEIIRRYIKYEISPSSLRVFATIAYKCLKRDRGERPSMDEIVIALQTALEYQVPPLPLTPSHSRCSNEYQRPLKPLHWEKTPALIGSLWDVSHNGGIQARAPKIDLSELERLFCKHKYRAHPGYEHDISKGIHLIHPDRASNCESVLYNIQLSLHDLMKAIIALDSTALSVDQVYYLIELCPTNEEIEILKSYTGDEKKLRLCEQFFLEYTKIPRLDQKLRVFAFTITFSRRVKIFRDTLNTIKDICKETKESTKLVKIMQIILTMGNKLNADTIEGSAHGFTLGSLEKLGDTYTTDKSMTLLHFLCMVVSEQTPELLDFYKDLIHLDDAYWIQIDNLYKEKSAMIRGFEEVQQEFDASANDDSVSDPFRKALKRFLDSAGSELPPLISFFDEVDQYADSLVVYFGEDPNHCSWKQVISSLVRFIEMFKKAHNQIKGWKDAKKKKLDETLKKEQVHITSLKIKPT